MKTNRILMVVAAAMFLLSFLSYRESVLQAERFERGQKLLPNLNPDEISQIVMAKDGVVTELERQGDRFVVQSEDGYPASNDTVNRFLKDVLGLGLEKEVGSGERLEEKLGLRPDTEGTLQVTLMDATGKDMASFLVGNAFEDGAGNYVQRRLNGEKSPVYLSSGRISLQTDGNAFVDKELLDVPQDEIATLRGTGFVFEQVDGALALSQLPSGKKESSKASQLKSVLSGLRFQEHLLANDPSLQGLRFTHQLEVTLKDQSGYVLAVAEQGGEHYLQIQGFHDVGQVSIAIDADEDAVRETSEQLSRGDEIKDFNALHGSFVYKVTQLTADKVRSTASDLMEDA